MSELKSRDRASRPYLLIDFGDLFLGFADLIVPSPVSLVVPCASVNVVR